MFALGWQHLKCAAGGSSYQLGQKNWFWSLLHGSEQFTLLPCVFASLTANGLRSTDKKLSVKERCIREQLYTPKGFTAIRV